MRKGSFFPLLRVRFLFRLTGVRARLDGVRNTKAPRGLAGAVIGVDDFIWGLLGVP